MMNKLNKNKQIDKIVEHKMEENKKNKKVNKVKKEKIIKDKNPELS